MLSGIHASIVLSILTDTGDSPRQGVYKLTITRRPKCERIISSMEGEPGGTCAKFSAVESPKTSIARGRPRVSQEGRRLTYTRTITPCRCKWDGVECNVYCSNIVVCWQRRCDKMRVCLKNGLA